MLNDKLSSLVGALHWWQWLALPLVIAAALLAGWGLGRATTAILMKLAKHSQSTWDDLVVEKLTGPARLMWAVVMGYGLASQLGLPTGAEVFIHSVFRFLVFLGFFGALLRAIDVGASFIVTSPWATTHTASHALVPLAVRVLKATVLVIAIVASLSAMGYPVASLLAGLGIGGLAVALASQKTVENLLGAFVIGADQPFREGDFVKIEDFVGTVERIGLRSTRIRTLDRTLISLPNGRLADMRLESFTARDRIRLSCVLGVVYSTSAAQMRTVLAGLEAVLRAHPRIWPDAVVVRFKEFGPSSLDIEIMAWFLTTDFGEFQTFRQEVFLQFIEVVQSAGSSFAFPTRTVHVVPAEPAFEKTSPADFRKQV